ncbi:MAG: hypothetical protein GC160_13340 [Acidobacteria bacterium]|nr:hypothetical protein [Acidobacteriota bacterium]
MARKIAERTLLRLAQAYAAGFPAEVAEALEEAETDEAASFLASIEASASLEVLTAAPDAVAAALLAGMEPEACERLARRLDRGRLARWTKLSPGLAARLASDPPSPTEAED